MYSFALPVTSNKKKRSPKMNILTKLPDGLLNLKANELHQMLNDHTLIHLQGIIDRPLFISLLQHGNETTGWEALKVFLNNYIGKLPRSLIIYFGNLEAARYNLRLLDGQPDFNRCWPGQYQIKNETAMQLAKITQAVQSMNPFASIDIHNNTGRNPHYAGINKLTPQFINLASLFSDTIIHFTSPDGIQSGAFASFCPSVTIECGMTGTADGLEQTITFLNNLIHLPNLNDVPGVAEHQEVLNIFSTVKIKPDIPFTIAEETPNAQFVIEKDLDRHNFHMLPKGTPFGYLVQGYQEMPLIVTDQIGQDITDHYFDIQNQSVILKQNVMPAMITQSERAIKLDCLCYLMRPFKREHKSEQFLRKTS